VVRSSTPWYSPIGLTIRQLRIEDERELVGHGSGLYRNRLSAVGRLEAGAQSDVGNYNS